ncbi:MAG: class I SAM-dependent methyltransferase [Streptosporangiaceae bacterium]
MTRVQARPAAVPAGPGGVAGVIASLVGTLGLAELPVRLRAWDGSEAGPPDGPAVLLRSPRALRRLLWHPGELGLAQAYVTGELDVEGDLEDGLRRVWRAVARPAASGGPGRAVARAPAAAWAATRAAAAAALRLHVLGGPLPPPASQLRVSGRRHSRARDRAVIAGHYDLPAAFYQLILDTSLAYSAAYWTSEAGDYTLADAQRDKLELICRKLGLAPGARLLDLGCGWGALTVHAARRHRVRVTAVTLSAQQGAHVSGRIRDLGLGDVVDVQVRDYRDAGDGPYDAVASVEMGEHVGVARYPRFCAALRDLVRPGGRIVIQQMSRGARAPGGGPFIESYIAPDMHMRPVGATIALLEQAGLEVTGAEAMREHYVRTIHAWQDNFEARQDQIGALLTAEQIRVWRLYLAGGALAFADGRMGVHQLLAIRR